MRIRGNTRVSLGYYNLRSLNIIKKVGELSEFFLREKKMLYKGNCKKNYIGMFEKKK